VYVAPAGAHLIVQGGCLRFDSGAQVCSQRPSGSVLFRSMARSLGPQGLGILLTGMGEDGAAGLRDMHEAGAYTIAEDETTAVVYGMPAAAVAMRAVSVSLPIEEIAPHVLQLLNPVPEVW